MSQEITHAGQGPTGMTSVNGTIGTTAATITLTSKSPQVTVVNANASGNIYVSFNGTATTSNAYVLPNSAYTFDGVNVASLSILGSTTSLAYCVIAH